MQSIKQNVLLISFFIFSSLIFFLGVSGHFKSMNPFGSQNEEAVENEQSFFRTLRLYSLEAQEPKLSLKASELLLTNNGKNLHFLEPIGSTFDKNKSEIFYEALRGSYSSNRQELILKDLVKVTLPDGQLETDYAQYLISKEQLKGVGNVKTQTLAKTRDEISVSADEVEAQAKLEKAIYRGKVSGTVKRLRAYEPPIDFGSDFLEFSGPLSLIVMTGNVSIKKQQLTANSLRGEIFLENYNKKLKYFALYDDVRVTEKVILDGPRGVESFTRRALSEKLEGIMSEEIVILTGYPRVYQQKDVIKGSRIVLRENNEVVEVDDANTNFILK